MGSLDPLGKSGRQSPRLSTLALEAQRRWSRRRQSDSEFGSSEPVRQRRSVGMRVTSAETRSSLAPSRASMRPESALWPPPGLYAHQCECLRVTIRQCVRAAGLYQRVGILEMALHRASPGAATGSTPAVSVSFAAHAGRVPCRPAGVLTFLEFILDFHHGCSSLVGRGSRLTSRGGLWDDENVTTGRGLGGCVNPLATRKSPPPPET